MPHKTVEDPIIAQFERLLRLLKLQRGVPIYDTLPEIASTAEDIVPFHERRVGDLRYSQQAKIHGNPMGMAKGTRASRTQRLEELRERMSVSAPEDQKAHQAAIDALGFALDAERFLGSFSWGIDRDFPISTINTVAENMISWLDHLGYQVVSIEKDRADG